MGALMTTKEELIKANGIIGNYTIDENGLYNVIGDVHLNCMQLTEIPIPFGTVTGEFFCIGNELTTLKNAPKYVGKSFVCTSNNLTSLEHAPKEVGGYFNCLRNLTNFTFEDVEKVCEVACHIYAQEAVKKKKILK